jgi:hypothetical protein
MFLRTKPQTNLKLQLKASVRNEIFIQLDQELENMEG